MSPSKRVKSATVPASEKPNVGTVFLRILALAVVVAITVYIFSIRDRVEEFAAYGYPGIFVIMLMANATVFLPAPGVAMVFAMGGMNMFNPLLLALSAGTGGVIGELSGYLAGFSGQAIVERTDIYERINPWIKKYGAWTILVLSAIPNPFFDIAGIAAGMAKMPLWKFMLFCWVGQVIKMALFAYAGAYSIDWVMNLTG